MSDSIFVQTKEMYESLFDSTFDINNFKTPAFNFIHTLLFKTMISTDFSKSTFPLTDDMDLKKQNTTLKKHEFLTKLIKLVE